MNYDSPGGERTRLYNFQKRIDDDNSDYPIWLKEWIKHRKNGADCQKLLKLNCPFTDDPQPFPNGKRFNKPSDYRPTNEVFYELTIKLSESSSKNIQTPLNIVPRYFFEDNFMSAEEIQSYFKTHGNYIRIQAVQLFGKYNASVLNRIHLFATFVFDNKGNKINLTKKIDDVESLLWEFVYVGKGINKKALRFQFGAWVRNKTRQYQKYGIDDTISLPYDYPKLEKFNLERINIGWKMSIPYASSDGPTFEEFIFNKAKDGFREK